MEQIYDVIVIGTGTSGKVVAYKCKEAGLSVAIIDKREFGGTCELRGCDPKKVLVGAAEIIDSVERYKEKNVLIQPEEISWKSLIDFKKTFTEKVPEITEKSLQEQGIDAIHGTASFIEKDKIKINGKVLKGKHIVIATGAIPQKLGYKGEEYIHNSEYFLKMDNLPEHIVFIGGGYISFEFAHIAKRAGAKVTIINRGSTLLKNFDQYLVSKLLDFSRSIGIEVKLNTNITGIEKTGSTYNIHIDSNESIKCDLIVHGAGRVPDIFDLELDKAGIEAGDKGIKVNKYMQSLSNPSIYAVGDVSDTALPLTPIGGKEGFIAATNIISGNHVMADFTVIPSAVFTIPPLAMVGMTEEVAKINKLDFNLRSGDSSQWYSSRRINEKVSAYKVILDKKTDRILGAHILGHNAEEIVNLFALAMKEGIEASSLKDLVYAYPTKASDIEYML